MPKMPRRPGVDGVSRNIPASHPALILLLLVISLGVVALPGPGGYGVVDAAAAQSTNQILVKFKSNASAQAIAALNSSQATQQVDAIPAIGLRVLRIPSGRSAATVAAAYAKNPLVQFAEPNALVAPEAIPNDPNYGVAWHLADIAAPAAWDLAKATGVLVAVCDSGVTYNHPDLSAALRLDLAWNAVDGSTNASDGAAGGHGTSVAGAAAAATNNGLGVAGVAWSAKLVPIRISNLSDGSALYSDAAKCITYAADHGARVINLSYLMAGSAAIDAAGQYALGKGAVTVVSAGNSGIDPGWPNYAGFLAVSATNSLQQLLSWSNRGAFVDLSAPGTNIWTTKYDGTYWQTSGTSLSSPITAGVLALMFGANPGLSATQAQSLLKSSADDLGLPGWDPLFGYGHVDAGRAVSAALSAGSAPSPSATPQSTSTAIAPTATRTSTPAISATATRTPTPASSTPTVAPGKDTAPPTVSLAVPGQTQGLTGNVTLSATASDNVGVARVEFYADGVLLRSDTSTPYSTSWNTRKAANGSHVVTAKAFDTAGNSATATLTVGVAN